MKLVNCGRGAGGWRAKYANNHSPLARQIGTLNIIVPVEVKAADNTQAKSYRQFCKRYAPPVGFKLSEKNLGENMCEDTRTCSVPLYLAWAHQRYS